MSDLTPAQARRALNDLIDQYGGETVFRVYSGRDDPKRSELSVDDVATLNDIGAELEDSEIMRKTGQRPEETPQGTAKMQEAGLRESDGMTTREARGRLREIVQEYGALKTFDTFAGRLDRTVAQSVPDDDELSVIVEVIGKDEFEELTRGQIDIDRIVRVSDENPQNRKYTFDDGGIAPRPYMDAIRQIERVLGDADQYEAGSRAGAVAFRDVARTQEFDSYTAARPEAAPEPIADDTQQSGGVNTDLGALEPETIEDDGGDADDRQQRTTQGTLGGDSPLDPGEFPTDPDPAAKRQREQMRREEQQESLEGDAPEFDPAADREARERRQRRAEQTQERIADDQADLTGDRVDADDVVPAEMVDDDDDQQGLASFINDDTGNGGGSGN